MFFTHVPVITRRRLSHVLYLRLPAKNIHIFNKTTMKKSLLLLCLGTITAGFAQSYPPAADAEGTTAIFKDSEQFVAWATGSTVERGFINK